MLPSREMSADPNDERRISALRRRQAARAKEFRRDLSDLAVVNQDFLIEATHGLVGECPTELFQCRFQSRFLPSV